MITQDQGSVVDLLRAWIISAVVFLGLNFLLSVTVGYDSFLLYALCPVLAGAAASLYHAEHGVGGWMRHVIAVLPMPAVFNGAWYFTQGRPEGLADWAFLGVPLVTALGLAALGLGIAMAIRWLLLQRSEA